MGLPALRPISQTIAKEYFHASRSLLNRPLKLWCLIKPHPALDIPSAAGLCVPFITTYWPREYCLEKMPILDLNDAHSHIMHGDLGLDETYAVLAGLDNDILPLSMTSLLPYSLVSPFLSFADTGYPDIFIPQ
jgi:hypothetical protein